MTSPETVTAEQLAHQWQQIRTKLAESMRLETLRRPLTSPWGVAAVATCVGFALGFAVGRRRNATPPADVEPPADEPLPDPPGPPRAPQELPDARTSTVGDVFRRIAIAGLNLLHDRAQQAADGRAKGPD